MDHRNLWIMAAALLSACSRPADTNPANNVVEEAGNGSAAVLPDGGNSTAPLVPPAPGTPGGLPDDKTPLEEPQGPIDPKSAEAAGQVMQQYGALLEQGRLAEARKLWGDSGLTDKQFASRFADYSEIHAQVGKPGDTEGAAGSIYVTVPFVLYGRLKAGGTFNRSGTATLRRVNDVDGATPAQLRWHISQIDLKPAG
ncbi:MAG: hypothetical protein ABI626_02180 [Sphingomicrobium sp.]